ncbi:PDDEXK nuclease domain-containing protein [Flammeovirga aprica]|uniref:DUF1016 domain-containing protein n=1 Tax=Flammeovirga aprica JL-4 TaxID=694437 RepID=A0A7X9NZA4_9BACT|nr:PDDEXK nuclease domain-containing protein [Flammeovirga aprica]NME66593.1 DUF1016 domain-containing protein [Flammeovirga aprica JL-4]
MDLVSNKEYLSWYKEVKSQIQNAQVKAVLAANKELIVFYYTLGGIIFEKIESSAWGDKALTQLANDLKNEFPNLKGFSRTNLYYIRQFYTYFNNIIVPQLEGQNKNKEIVPQSGGQLVKQLVCQLPWGHIKVIISKIKSPNEMMFYVNEIIENHWSRDTFELQLKSNLYQRQGKAITNFSTTLPAPQSDLAKQTIKDPYLFDFVTLSEPYVERDIENQLVNHISKFLLELGKGFAFMGRQYHLEIAENDYYLDLLFYHVKLKAYVVVELKNTKFIPEYAGKMNFYLSAVDSLVKGTDDNPTIGILLCRDKNNLEAEFALRGINKPMGISEFQFTEVVPDNLKSDLPTIEELERGLNLGNED